MGCARHRPRKVRSSSNISLALVSRCFDRRLLLENPCEFVLCSGIVVVDCPRATIVTVFQDSWVLTEGHLRVSFASGLKIRCWEFSTRKHEELVRIDDARPREASVNDYGLPDMYSRYMQVSVCKRKRGQTTIF